MDTRVSVLCSTSGKCRLFSEWDGPMTNRSSKRRAQCSDPAILSTGATSIQLVIFQAHKTHVSPFLHPSFLASKMVSNIPRTVFSMSWRLGVAIPVKALGRRLSYIVQRGPCTNALCCKKNLRIFVYERVIFYFFCFCFGLSSLCLFM